MNRLYLVRHAKSDWSTDAPTDFDRPLNDRGLKARVIIANHLLQKGYRPDVVISSSACRARQTIEGVFEQTGWDDAMLTFTDALYLASLNDLIGFADAARDTCESLMLVGHNPGMEDFLKYLCGSDLPLTENGKLFTTANVAVIDLALQGVQKGGRAKLVELIRP